MSKQKKEYKNDILSVREKQWGNPLKTHQRIADVWVSVLGDKMVKGSTITPYEVALMMSGLKLVRASINPSDPDSLIDAQGYTELAQLFAKEENKTNE